MSRPADPDGGVGVPADDHPGHRARLLPAAPDAHDTQDAQGGQGAQGAQGEDPRTSPPPVVVCLVTASWADPARPAARLQRELDRLHGEEVLSVLVDVSQPRTVPTTLSSRHGASGGPSSSAPEVPESADGASGITDDPGVRIGAALESDDLLDLWSIDLLPTWIRCEPRTPEASDPSGTPEAYWEETLRVEGALAKHEVAGRLYRAAEDGPAPPVRA